jgi:putative heme transporter
MASGNEALYAAPPWLRNLGYGSWLLVGFVLVLVGVTWLVAETSTITMPVIVAGVLGSVAGPIVGWLQTKRVPRAAGAALVLLGLFAIGVGIFVLVVAGITSQSAEISSNANGGLDKLQDWAASLGADQTEAAKQSLQNALPEIRHTLISGVAHTVEGLASLAFFLSFALLATFFVLKDAPVMKAFINRHLGLPLATAEVVTSQIATSFRKYFGGLTIIAAFNGAVVGLGAWILGVPLAGTIAIVTFVTAYVPIVGAWVAGIFAFLLALGSQGASDAFVLALIILLANGALQNILQPFVYGAALQLNPLAVLVVTIGAGCLFGLVGMTLAAPLTSAAVHISNQLRARDEPGESPPTPTEEAQWAA